MQIHFKIPHIKTGLTMRSESEAVQFGRDARRDWQFVFITFLVLNILSVALGIFMYSRVNSGEIFLVDKRVLASQSALDKVAFEKIVGLFEERRGLFETWQTSTLSTRDPFLAPLSARAK